jgi:hypothetical protein
LFLERVVFHPGPPEHARELTLLIDHPGGQTSLPIPLLDPRSTIDSRPPG